MQKGPQIARVLTLKRLTPTHNCEVDLTLIENPAALRWGFFNSAGGLALIHFSFLRVKKIPFLIVHLAKGMPAIWPDQSAPICATDLKLAY